MKKIFLILFAISLVGCSEDNTEDLSFVTYYPDFTLIGDETMFVQKGSTFTDPGVIVTEQGEEIEYTVSVNGQYRGGNSVDTNVDDVYVLTYSAVNQDGFPGTITRRVVVAEMGDLTTSIAGVYRSTVLRNGAGGAQYNDMEFALIYEEEDGTYTLIDGIGLYYSTGRAYGNTYLAPASITANNIATDDFTVPDFTVGTFGGVVQMLSFTANEDDNSIDFTSSWDSGYIFEVHLDQVQF